MLAKNIFSAMRDIMIFIDDKICSTVTDDVREGNVQVAVFSSGLAVNEETYSTKCLPDVPAFIKRYHAKKDVVFCPDLVSVHCASRSLENM